MASNIVSWPDFIDRVFPEINPEADRLPTWDDYKRFLVDRDNLEMDILEGALDD